MSEQKNESEEKKVVVTEEKDEDVDIDLDIEDENQDEEKDADKDKGEKSEKKVEETPQARVARLQRQLKRAQKDAGIEEEAPDKKTSKNSELGYGEKAFLVANGIKGKEETALVRAVMTSTGKSLEDVLESKYFQAELKEIREAKTTKDAIPTGTKRSAQTQATEVEYWIQKGELPPVSQRELRTAVVNARIKAQKSGNVFTDTPVTGK